jgi:death-on-curing protein
LKTALDRLIVDLDDTLLRLLADPHRTVAGLSRQELAETFFELVVAEFGIAPPEPGQEDAWGDRFTAHLCLVETYESAGRPESFPFKQVLPPPVHWDRCRGFLGKWQHHELFKSAFRQRAKAIDGQYPLGPWAAELAPTPVSGAFLNVEKALWAEAQRELAGIQSKADAVAFARERRKTFQARAEGFWAREGEVPGWRALARMAGVILSAQEALDEFDQYTTPAVMVEAYTRRWWGIDRDYRRFRVELDRGAGGLDAALKWTERIYHDYLDEVNSRFTETIAREGTWPLKGQALGGSTLWEQPARGAKGLLEPAAARPQATYGGQDLVPDLFSKAAALMDSLVHNHPFVDGNKRTGITTASLFLVRNGYRLTTTHPELEAFTRRVAEARPDMAEIADWLQAHSVPLE